MCCDAMVQRVCERESDCEREEVNALDRSFEADGEEEGFWHERGQCVIMMSLGVYSETDGGGCCTALHPGDVITN